MSDEGKISRRDFIIGAFGGFAATVGSQMAADSLSMAGRVPGLTFRLVRNFGTAIERIVIRPSERALISQNLLALVDSANLGISAGDDHPNWPQKRHPDNFEPAGKLLQALRSTSAPVQLVEGVESDSVDDIVLLGSVTSNYRAKAVFAESNFLELPITYESPEGATATTTRYVGGMVYQADMKTLRVQSGKAGDYLNLRADFEQVDGKRWLKTDYLLITCVPNFLLGDQALSNYGRAFLVGGLQGAGTQAFPSLLANRDVYQALIEHAKNEKFFQALVRVGHVEHDGEKRESRPHDLEFMERFFEPLNEGRLYDLIEQHLSLKP